MPRHQKNSEIRLLTGLIAFKSRDLWRVVEPANAELSLVALKAGTNYHPPDTGGMRATSSPGVRIKDSSASSWFTAKRQFASVGMIGG